MSDSAQKIRLLKIASDIDCWLVNVLPPSTSPNTQKQEEKNNNMKAIVGYLDGRRLAHWWEKFTKDKIQKVQNICRLLHYSWNQNIVISVEIITVTTWGIFQKLRKMGNCSMQVFPIFLYSLVPLFFTANNLRIPEYATRSVYIVSLTFKILYLNICNILSLSTTTGFSITRRWIIVRNYKLKTFNKFKFTLTKVLLVISLNTEFFVPSENHW